jgi:hypothetical protein
VEGFLPRESEEPGRRQVAVSVLAKRIKCSQVSAMLAVARIPNCAVSTSRASGIGEGAAMALGTAAMAQRVRKTVERRLFILVMNEREPKMRRREMR